MNIEKKSVNELKSLAYDIIVTIQNLQNDLIRINQEIMRKQNEPEIENGKKATN